MSLPVNFERDVYCLLGLPFDAIDLVGAIRQIDDSIRRRRPCLISTPNINFAVGCLVDAEFRNSVITSDLCVADGMPLVWIAKLLGIPIQERISGAGMFDALRARRGVAPISVFLFGGPEGSASAACAQLNAEAGGLTCSGSLYPGFGTVAEMSTTDVISTVNASGADFLVVSLGAKKGLAWIERNHRKLSSPVISHLGAVINFVAGYVRRAPKWTQRLGLEWLWRIKEEPQLWRRYLRDGVTLLRLILTRILPYCWRTQCSPSRVARLPSGAIEITNSSHELVIRLSGAWTKGNLDPLRRAFATAMASGRDIRVDLGQATSVDAASLGLMLLLYGAQRAAGRRFVCAPVCASVRKTFRYCCAEFLLREEVR